jgi:hypothetical protein
MIVQNFSKPIRGQLGISGIAGCGSGFRGQVVARPSCRHT